MKLRPATIEDLVALLPARLPRRHFQAYMVQLRRSVAFTAIDEHGVMAVGGLYPDDGEREAWLHVRAAPRVRVKALLLAAATVLEHADGEWPITAVVDAGSARNLRFAEFLGFVSSHAIAATSLTPRSVKLTRIA